MVWKGYGPFSKGKIGHELQSIIFEPFFGASWQRWAIPFLTQRVQGLLLSHDIWDLRHTTQAWNTFFLLGFLTSDFFSSTFTFLLLSSLLSSFVLIFFLSFTSTLAFVVVLPSCEASSFFILFCILGVESWVVVFVVVVEDVTLDDVLVCDISLFVFFFLLIKLSNK